MNPVNGFTPEGLPTLILSNMPVQSTSPALTVTRPEIYFGELTNTDVYVKTRQKEFNYPQGETNNLTSYEGNGGIVLGGFFRRLLIALDRGDLAKLPFSDDVTAGQPAADAAQHPRARRGARAVPHLRSPIPYIVVGDDGRLSWMMDGFTTSGSLSRTRGTTGSDASASTTSATASRPSSTPTTARRRSTCSTPRIRSSPRTARSSRRCSRTRRRCRPDLRKHVRYPELLLQLQAAVYGLYHMTDPEVFYNREDLWTRRERSRHRPTARAGDAADGAELRADEAAGRDEHGVRRDPAVHAGEPQQPDRLDCRAQRRPDTTARRSSTTSRRRRLVDGPLQIEARIDQNAQLSGQLSLWNQQGSHVRRGSLIVIPIGRALLYAEPIYLQAERSPMPELRLVVLALQDRLAYGPTFEAAMAALFGNAPSTLAAAPGVDRAATRQRPRPPARDGAVSGACAGPTTLIARRRARPRRLSAADRRRQARRGRPEARSAEAEAGTIAEQTQVARWLQPPRTSLGRGPLRCARRAFRAGHARHSSGRSVR